MDQQYGPPTTMGGPPQPPPYQPQQQPPGSRPPQAQPPQAQPPQAQPPQFQPPQADDAEVYRPEEGWQGREAEVREAEIRQAEMEPDLRPEAKPELKEVAESAFEHGREVKDEVVTQTKMTAEHMRDRLNEEARTQTERLSGSLRQLSGEFQAMESGHNGPDSAARNLVRQMARSGEQIADYLDRHGPDELLHEAQEFARRKPGVFLLGAAVAGFAVGRFGKALLTTPQGAPQQRRVDPDTVDEMPGDLRTMETHSTPVGEARP